VTDEEMKASFRSDADTRLKKLKDDILKSKRDDKILLGVLLVVVIVSAILSAMIQV